MLRTLRRQVARRVSYAAAVTAPRLPAGAARAAERLIKSAGPHLPVLAAMVRENLRSADLYRPDVLRAYFEQVGRHFGNALRIFKTGGDPAAVARLAESQIGVDEAVSRLPQLAGEAGGLVIAPPHVCNYLLTLVRLNQIVPLSVYLRWSKDERKRLTKERWCRAAGLEVILEQPSAADPTSRAMACVEAVRRGRALVMTPDLAQKSEQGLGIELLGRRVFLPSGPASIAMLAEVPLVPVYGRTSAGRHEIRACAPIRVPALTRAQGGRAAALLAATQAWARHFERFLRAEPQAWFFWGDAGWSRVFHGDPRYVQPLSPPRGAEKPSAPVVRAIENYRPGRT